MGNLPLASLPEEPHDDHHDYDDHDDHDDHDDQDDHEHNDDHDDDDDDDEIDEIFDIFDAYRRDSSRKIEDLEKQLDAAKTHHHNLILLLDERADMVVEQSSEVIAMTRKFIESESRREKEVEELLEERAALMVERDHNATILETCEAQLSETELRRSEMEEDFRRFWEDYREVHSQRTWLAEDRLNLVAAIEELQIKLARITLMGRTDRDKVLQLERDSKVLRDRIKELELNNERNGRAVSTESSEPEEINAESSSSEAEELVVPEDEEVRELMGQ